MGLGTGAASGMDHTVRSGLSPAYSPQLSTLQLSKQSPCCALCFLNLNLGSWADAELGEPVTSAQELAGLHALTPGALNPALLPRGQRCRSSGSSTRGSSARGVCRTLSG